jgi:hypothetical protein
MKPVLMDPLRRLIVTNATSPRINSPNAALARMSHGKCAGFAETVKWTDAMLLMP